MNITSDLLQCAVIHADTLKSDVGCTVTFIKDCMGEWSVKQELKILDSFSDPEAVLKGFYELFTHNWQSCGLAKLQKQLMSFCFDIKHLCLAPQNIIYRVTAHGKAVWENLQRIDYLMDQTYATEAEWEASSLEIGQKLGEIVHWMTYYEEGKVKPQVDRAFSFDKAGDAHAYIEARKNRGKVLLVP